MEGLEDLTFYRRARTTACSKLFPAQTYLGGLSNDPKAHPLCFPRRTARYMRAARAAPDRPQSNSGKQSEPTTKSVAGKVTSIGNSGTSFAVEVEGASKQTMQFVVNKNTQVQGQVKVGTLVAVDYQPAENGQNLAVSIAVRG